MNPDQMPRNAARDEAPVWNGLSWPPPVGSYVECAGNDALIVHVDDDGYVVGWDDKHKVSGTMDRGSCRPMRTAPERAEGAVIDVLRVELCINDMAPTIAASVIDAIRDGKIPGVRWEADAA